MNREFHRWHSPALGREMELLIHGHAGTPTIVFPSSMGRFFEYEDRGMIGAIQDRYEQGHMQAFCPDSVDLESWYNKGAHPADRARRQAQYNNYIVNELVPLIRQRNGSSGIATTGCSFGGYHAMNIALQRPDIFTACVSMSGAFDIKQFLHGYYDDNCYFNNPVDFLPGMDDGWYLSRYRGNRYILAAGDWDICLGENRRMDGIMEARGVPHRLDVWGERSEHDWPLWQRMAQAYFR
ncbi:MAG TPA: alpha/beta hydrolase-fold protein [Bryobacteraceae bacterium]|nr:alpha/beta hydrolase-fold protein [Bryobacteraceae bacterium]